MQDLADDLRLMYHNAMKYNGEGHELHRLGEESWAAVLQLLRPLQQQAGTPLDTSRPSGVELAADDGAGSVRRGARAAGRKRGRDEAGLAADDEEYMGEDDGEEDEDGEAEAEFDRRTRRAVSYKESTDEESDADGEEEEEDEDDDEDFGASRRRS